MATSSDEIDSPAVNRLARNETMKMMQSSDFKISLLPPFPFSWISKYATMRLRCSD